MNLPWLTMLYRSREQNARRRMADLMQAINLAYVGSRNADVGHKMEGVIGELRKDV
jgi:hypothetical protein